MRHCDRSSAAPRRSGTRDPSRSPAARARSCSTLVVLPWAPATAIVRRSALSSCQQVGARHHAQAALVRRGDLGVVDPDRARDDDLDVVAVRQLRGVVTGMRLRSPASCRRVSAAEGARSEPLTVARAARRPSRSRSCRRRRSPRDAGGGRSRDEGRTSAVTLAARRRARAASSAISRAASGRARPFEAAAIACQPRRVAQQRGDLPAPGARRSHRRHRGRPRRPRVPSSARSPPGDRRMRTDTGPGSPAAPPPRPRRSTRRSARRQGRRPAAPRRTHR